ncbi:MAG: ABC transporter ATP-binding protein [Chthoniobacter sp.]|nr:ABC transporter ATP-binding protein [Chthoniobacter sp.]
MSVVIKLENLGKRYRLGNIDRRMLYEELQRRWARFRGKEDPFSFVNDAKSAKGVEQKEIWALKDINLEIRDGDVVGIIGRNGSGKSTLLKILSKITAPTEGRAMIKGRVASLLEVGTGFHAELTGRENVYMNASILGMTKVEIDGKFDEIVDFSGVEKFIDTPVKRYSSGMMVRLAFAVAAHLEPEIMIIDEVLAVGDSAFQQKCLTRMNKVAREGRTILFVSHQAAAVENLCTRGVVLENGKMRFDGTQTEAIGFYVNSFTQQTGSLRERTDRRGNGQIRVTMIEFRDSAGRVVTSAQAGQDIDVFLHFENLAPHIDRRDLYVSLNVKNDLDVPIFTQSNLLTGEQFAAALPERGAIVCRLRRLPLPTATFRLNYMVCSAPTGGVVLDSIDNAMELRIEGGDFFATGQLPSVHQGVALVDGQWRLENVDAPAALDAKPEMVLS